MKSRINQIAHSWVETYHRIRSKLKWVGFILTPGAIFYLVYSLATQEIDFNLTIFWKFRSPIIYGLLLYLLSMVMQFCIWSRIIIDHRKVDWEDVEIYIRTILMRSLPGGAWHWIGRVSLYSSHTSIPSNSIVLGTFLEWVLLILVGGSFAIFSQDNPITWLPIALLLLTALSLVFFWQSKEKQWYARLVEAVLWVSVDILIWLVGAVIFYIFVAAITGSNAPGWLNSIKIWSISGTAGILISFLPSGIGIREITLTTLLSPYMPFGEALLIAVWMRVLYYLADLSWGILGLSILIGSKYFLRFRG